LHLLKIQNTHTHAHTKPMTAKVTGLTHHSKTQIPIIKRSQLGSARPTETGKWLCTSTSCIGIRRWFIYCLQLLLNTNYAAELVLSHYW